MIYANGFLGYRNDSQHNYKPEDYEVLTDELSNLGLNQTLQDVIGSWLDHAVDATNRNGYYKKGKNFENWIKGQLSSNTSAVYKAVESKITDLAERSIYSQVQFCLNNDDTGNCTGEGDYFVADFVFVKEVVIGNTTILDVKIADTKLSASTNFTENQRKANKPPIGYYIKSYQSSGNPIIGNSILRFQKPNQVNVVLSFYKIYSSGSINSFGGIK